MESNIIPTFSAIWLGMLTSISPCPLATNIAATSYIGSQIKSSYSTLIAGLSYAIGRAIAYVGISIIIVLGLLSIPDISFFLQKHMGKVIGPLLIVSGLVILKILPINFSGFNPVQRFQKLFGSGGVLGTCLLGFVFALSFCPSSAALFFGGLIPLSLKYESKLLLPVFYGVGTALPVLFFAIILSSGSRLAGVFFDKLSVVELWLRRITGLLFLVIGVYFSLKYSLSFFLQ
jgi:cytochrome c biogenesis protein CcdA